MQAHRYIDAIKRPLQLELKKKHYRRGVYCFIHPIFFCFALDDERHAISTKPRNSFVCLWLREKDRVARAADFLRNFSSTCLYLTGFIS